MEVDDVARKESDVLVAVKAMQRQLQQIDQRTIKLENTGRRTQRNGTTNGDNNAKANADKPNSSKQRPRRRFQQRYNWASDGKPICNYCKQVGHMYRDCKQRVETAVANPSTPLNQE